MRPALSLIYFLEKIWSESDSLLFGPWTAEEGAKPTLESRIYEQYNSCHPERGDLMLLAGKIERLKGMCGSFGFTYKPQGKAFAQFWQYSADDGDWRVYLNPALEMGPELVANLFALGRLQTDKPPPVPPRTDRPPLPQRPPPVPPRTDRPAPLQTTVPHVISMVKIAVGAEALMGRADRIVAYVCGDEDAALALAKKVAASGSTYRFNQDVPPMTRGIAPGISIGKEISVVHFTVGTSFGELRCNIIAESLVRIKWGMSY